MSHGVEDTIIFFLGIIAITIALWGYLVLESLDEIKKILKEASTDSGRWRP